MKLQFREGGFTFTEVLVALALLAIVAAPVALLFTTSCTAMARAGCRTAAANLCREKMEQIKSGGISGCLDSIEGSPGGLYLEVEELNSGARVFRRETSLQLIDAAPGGDSGSIPLIHIVLRVSWSEHDIEHAVEMESYLARL